MVLKISLEIKHHLSSLVRKRMHLIWNGMGRIAECVGLISGNSNDELGL